MRATGIVRRIDDLGRVIIPKEVRRSMGISEGSPLEMYIDSETNGLVLIPYHNEASSKLKGIAENLNSMGTTSEHWQIAKELKEIAKRLEAIE